MADNPNAPRQTATAAASATRTPGADYFEKRGLTRHAGAWSLWALGVAAVISGDFSGWNLGIGEAGWGGMLVATVVIGLMYLLMVYSIAEMSATMPHTGGAYSFARSAMGPWGGFVTGLAETIEYVITTAVVGTFCRPLRRRDHRRPVRRSPCRCGSGCVVFYVVFVALNSAGAAASFRFAVVIAIISLAVLGVLRRSPRSSPASSAWDNLWNIDPEAGDSTFLPFGVGGRARGPAVRHLVLPRDRGAAPRGRRDPHPAGATSRAARLMGMLTLLVTAFLVLVLNPGVLGSEEISGSGEPILDGFRAIFPNSNIASLLALFALAGLVASFQGIMFAAGRNMYSLSRAGYYPKVLSLTGGARCPTSP